MGVTGMIRDSPFPQQALVTVTVTAMDLTDMAVTVSDLEVTDLTVTVTDLTDLTDPMVMATTTTTVELNTFPPDQTGTPVTDTDTDTAATDMAVTDMVTDSVTDLEVTMVFLTSAFITKYFDFALDF